MVKDNSWCENIHVKITGKYTNENIHNTDSDKNNTIFHLNNKIKS